MPVPTPTVRDDAPDQDMLTARNCTNVAPRGDASRQAKSSASKLRVETQGLLPLDVFVDLTNVQRKHSTTSCRAATASAPLDVNGTKGTSRVAAIPAGQSEGGVAVTSFLNGGNNG